jgi:hypothetical protein
MVHLRRRRSPLFRGLVATAGLLVAAGSCATARDTGGLDPRYVAVHNALAATGLVEVGPIRHGPLAQGHEARLTLELTAQCTTIIVMGSEGVHDLDVTLEDPGGASVGHDTSHEGQAAVRACVESAGAFTLIVRAGSGSGEYVLATWAGAALGAGLSSTAPASGGAAQQTGTCEAPIRIGAGEFSGSTTHGESENEGTCANSAARELVYRLDLAARQSVSVDVTTQRFDSVLYVRKGDCTDDGAEVACNDDSPNQHRSRIDAVLDPGTYFVFVDGYGSDGGPFQMRVAIRDIPPLAEICGKAPHLVSGASLSGATSGTFDEVNATCGDGAHGPDAPYALDVAARSRARIKDASDDFEPVVHVRKRCADESTEVGCAAAESGEHEATFVGYLDPGAYTVFADARDHEADGHYALLAELVAGQGSGGAGDSCADALPLPLGEHTVTGDTFTARDDTSGKCGGAGAADVFYKLELAKRSRLVAQFKSEEAEHVFVVSKTCADHSTEMACGRTIDEVLPAGTYFLAVDGESPDAFGAFSFDWSLRDIAAQEAGCRTPELIADGQTIVGTTAGASNKFGPGCGGQGDAGDRVYRITLSARARVRLALSTPRFTGVLALRASCLDAPATRPAELACNSAGEDVHHAHIEANLDPGTYFVVVDGKGRDGEGAFTLQYHVVR